MKHRNVVANFLFKSDSGQTLVALFRRSTHPNIRSYQGKLAPISGSIDAADASPLEAAVREIREETQLIAHKDIILRYAGKPFSFTDDEAQRSWTVYAFGWSLRTVESKIKLDWEHSGWEWIKPEHVLTETIAQDCVPKIDQSLKRVYFGPLGMFAGEPPLVLADNLAGRTFQSTMSRLRTDKENGARVLATEALKGLRQLVEAFSSAYEPSTFDRLWWDTFRTAAYHLIYSARPSMNAAIKSAILQPLKEMQMLSRENPPQLSALCAQIDASISQRSQASAKISRAFQDYVNHLPFSSVSRSLNIVTISSSSTIRSSLLHLLAEESDLNVRLSILESRPLCEGASLAETLLQSLEGTGAQSRLHITLSPDCHAASVIQQSFSKNPEEANIVLLGADRITPSGHVSNKMGSLMLAVLAKTLAPQSHVVVLSECDKIATPSNLAEYEDGKQDSNKELREHAAEANDPNEVIKIWPTVAKVKELDKNLFSGSWKDRVDVENFYFEMVNNKWIDTYICEDGPQQREDILAKSIEMGRLEERVFGRLYED